jgi:hypothetical protein
MSDPKKNFHEDLILAQEKERKRREIAEKELQLKERRINTEIDRLNKDDLDLEKAKKANFGQMSAEDIQQIRKDNSEYMAAARGKIQFILPIFGNAVPFFRKNLIFIGAKTGEGKSTAVANIVRNTIRQLGPDGNRKRVLVITNEEKREDVYNRITCLINGWAYTNHDKFSDHQLETFDKFIPMLSTVVTVIDDSHGGGSGMTTTPEGLQTIFENSMRDGTFYDAIVIDYYQNFTYTRLDTTLNEWQVQSRVASILDKYKNSYPAPIVMFGQVTPAGEENTPFEFRIKGRKQIIVPSTMVMEMIAHRQDLKTEWLIHKSRFNEYVGGSIVTGFNKGQFVPYDSVWLAEVLKIKENRQKRELEKSSGIKFNTEEKKDEKVPETTEGS